MYVKTRLIAALFATALVVLAQSAFAKEPPRELHYSVDIGQTQLHTVHVTLKPMGFKSKVAYFQMPVWAPGAYSVSHYGKYVQNFAVIAKTDPPKKGESQHDPEAKQINDDRWEITNADRVDLIEYDVLDSHADTTSLYFAMANMDSTLFFANATALFGYYDDDKNVPATVHYDKPANWKIVCSLPPSKAGYVQDTDVVFQNTDFYAKDYDQLADSPVMAGPSEGPPYMLTRSFKVGKAVYDLAIASDVTFAAQKLDSLVDYLRRVVHAETDFFHDTPFDHYTFIVYAPSMRRTPSMAQGALEHMNASDYMISNFAWPMMRSQFIPIYSHEFFHLWNVKRIHSSLLGPFDYTQRVKTTSLWLAEGITEYYAHTLLTRYHILPEASFYNTITEWLSVMKMMPDTSAAYKKSLEQLSIDESDFKLDEAELFYIKGPLVGLMLDLEIRKRTNNKYNLDTVMLALNAAAKKGKTFKDEDLIKVVSKLAHTDLTDFYAKYIRGTDSLPIDQYLAMMGVERSVSDKDNTDLQDEKLKKAGPMLIELNAPAEAAQYRKEIVGE